MCGRFTREFTWRQVHDFLNLKFPSAAEMKPSYNIAPTQDIPVCRADERSEVGEVVGGRALRIMRWGLIPFWSKDASKSYINARSETVAQSRAFRQAFERRRCLIPASGFYEWAKTPEGKIPHYIRVKDEPIFCFAGIWEAWSGGGGGHGGEGGQAGDEPIETAAILTTDANAVVAPIHDRMPVIIEPSHFDEWLFSERPRTALFKPLAARKMHAFVVSTSVNNPRNTASPCLEGDDVTG